MRRSGTHQDSAPVERWTPFEVRRSCEKNRVPVPIEVPVVPSPAERQERTDSKSQRKRNPGSRRPPGLKTWAHPHGISKNHSGIIDGHVNHIGIGWLDDDRVPSRLHSDLRITSQGSRFLCFFAQILNWLPHFIL